MPFEVTAIIDSVGQDQRAYAQNAGQEIQAAYTNAAARVGEIIAAHSLWFSQTARPLESDRSLSVLHLVAEYPMAALSSSFEVITILSGSGQDLVARAEKGRQEIQAAYNHAAEAAGTIVAAHTTLPRPNPNNRSVLYLVAKYPQ